MNINVDELRALSVSEKLDLVEMIWDDLGESATAVPLPAWAEQEAQRRREELLNNPTAGLSHEEVWHRINGR
jgi:putative addiction module component (TIGR02574 family)